MAAIVDIDNQGLEPKPPVRRRRLTTFTRRIYIPRNDYSLINRYKFDSKSLETDAFEAPDIDDFAPSPPKPRSLLARPPALKDLRPVLFLYVLFYAASLTHWNNGAGSALSLSRTQFFAQGEWWRAITALFTHSGMEHLSANTPLFLIFGWLLRSYFGPWTFPTAAILVGILSNIATIWSYPPHTSLVGASGMLYGMVALWLVLYIRHDTDHKVSMRILRATGVALMLLFPTSFHKTTSYLAHAWGFVFGLGAGLLLAPFVRPRDSQTSEPGKASVIEFPQDSKSSSREQSSESKPL